LLKYLYVYQIIRFKQYELPTILPHSLNIIYIYYIKGVFMQTESTTSELTILTEENGRAKETRESKLKDFITPEFISKYSNFTDMEHLFNESNFKIESEKDIDTIMHDELNKFIIEHTTFDSWNEMHKTAMALYIKK